MGPGKGTSNNVEIVLDLKSKGQIDKIYNKTNMPDLRIPLESDGN